MKEIIKTLMQKVNLNEEQANKTVDTVVTYLKDKMPNGIGKQVETFLKNEPVGPTGIKEKISGVFNR
ncbi:MAG TPA: hypothetical protein VF145_13380 [Chitinophagaceae bacterium]